MTIFQPQEEFLKVEQERKHLLRLGDNFTHLTNSRGKAKSFGFVVWAVFCSRGNGGAESVKFDRLNIWERTATM